MPLDAKDELNSALHDRDMLGAGPVITEAIDALIKERIAQAAWAIVQGVDDLKAEGYTPEYGFEPIRALLDKAWGDAT